MSCLGLVYMVLQLVITIANPSTEEPFWVASTAVTILLQTCALQELNNIDGDLRVAKDWMPTELMLEIFHQLFVFRVPDAFAASVTFTVWSVR